jgi:hypothetical protein
VIYVSDSATESHYRLSHEKNRGAEEVGDIVVDFTFLRDQGMITPVDGAFNSSNKKVGKKHWVVKFTIVIKVVDRDLTCKLDFPFAYTRDTSKKGDGLISEFSDNTETYRLCYLWWQGDAEMPRQYCRGFPARGEITTRMITGKRTAAPKRRQPARSLAAIVRGLVRWLLLLFCRCSDFTVFTVCVTATVLWLR